MEIKLDPRTKMLMILLAALYITLQFEMKFEMLLVTIFVLPFLLSGLHKYWVGFLLVFFTQILASLYLLPRLHSPFLMYIVSFLTNGFRLLLPGIIAGIYAMKTTTISEWIAAFKKWHVPNWLMIPIAVMARFFPAIKEDYQHIKKAMAFRGIGSNFKDFLKHPMQSLEYILIPLLMNATQVAEDLTVSALTKGLSLHGKHTTILKLSMSRYDWLYLMTLFIPLLFRVGGSFL